MWSRRLRGDGYVDFEDDDYYLAHFRLLPYWRAGTVLGCAPLAAVLYAVAEWCLQSHLWSADFAKAVRGLRRARRVRRACLHFKPNEGIQPNPTQHLVKNWVTVTFNEIMPP
jgi:hypothetical protein